MAKDVSITEFKGDAKNLVSAIDQIKTHTDDLDKSLKAVLTHLNDIEKGLKNVNSITNNAKSITNNISAQNNTNAFNVGTQRKIVKGHNGSFMGSDTGLEKAFKDYQQAVIDETKEITKDIAERRRRRKQRADAETTSAEASKLRASKLEDQTSARYLDRMDKLAEAKLLNAKANQVGAYLKDPRYQTGKAIGAIGGVVSRYGVGGKLVGEILDSVGMFIKAGPAGAAGVAVAVTNLAKAVSYLGSEAVKAYSEIESIKTQLGIVYSSQTQANTAFGEISEYAVHSPFGIQQTSELAVLLKQSGVYASDLMDTLRMLGDTAGGNMEKMKRIANNYAQIVSIGKASMLDMRQFAYAGIPIFEAVSKELGVSQQQLRKLISDGKVTSDIIEKVFKDLTGINGIFENATAIGAKTLKARLQNLSDARQLGFASVGEWITNIGTRQGNDAYANKIVSWAENLWQYIRDNVNTKNIENSVNAIENRDLEIDNLKKLIEYNKEQGKDTKNLEKMLEQRLSAIDLDKDRQTYASLYDEYTKIGLDFSKNMGDYVEETMRLMDEKEANNREFWMERTQEQYGTGIWRPINALNNLGFSGVKMFSQEMAALLGVSALSGSTQALKNEDIDMRLDVIADILKALENDAKLFDKLYEASRERNLLSAQKLSYDEVNKYADKAGSLSSSFQELTEVYKSSDEYKQKEEEEKKKRLEEALTELKKIAKNTDESGTVDITKFSSSELLNYIKNGAFKSVEELDVVPKNGQYSAEDRALLEKQYGYISSLIRTNLKAYGFDNAASIMDINSVERLMELSNEDFYNQFKNVYDSNIKTLNTVKEQLPKKGEQASLVSAIDDFIKLLNFSTNRQEVETTGTNVTASMLSNATDEFIPLWKRILAQYTGLTAQGMTSTQQTLENYQNDMAIRNIASNVLQATMSSVGLNTAMSLMRAGDLKQLRGDVGGTYQIDWQETKKAMHNFATQLSASTAVISAYKKGLEDELSTYQQLVAAGYSQAESQDIKRQKTVSAKQMSKLVMDAGEQLVNAFGEKFITASGSTAYLREDGLFYDEKGVQIQEEELILTGNLFKMINTRLGQLYTEIHEANVAEVRNKAFENAVKEIKASQLTSKSLDYSSESGARLSKYILDNQDDFLSVFDSALKVARNRHKTSSGNYGPGYEFLENMSDNDILAVALEGKESEYADEISEILLKAIEIAKSDLGLLTENSTYQNSKNLANQNEKINAMNEALEKLAHYQQTGRYTNELRPEDYGGWRGDRNFLLRALGLRTENFDKEDFYLQAARAGYKSDNVDLSAFKDSKKSDKDLLDALEKADKKALDLEYHFEQIKNTIDEMATGMINATNEFLNNSFLAPFEKWGEYLAKDTDYMEELGASMKDITADLVASLGSYAAKAGLSLIAMGAEEHNWGLIGAGAVLAAAGGFASGLGNAIKDTSANKDKDDKAKKMEDLKNDLTKLLEQARTDALYYENNLRHKTALGLNQGFSYKSVHDAIITPKGIVETDPKDYLIATKTPGQFGGGNVTVTPIINNNVINNTSSKVRQEQQQNADGSIDIITIIEEATGNYIASAKSDSAFEAREYRMRGKSVVM